MDGRLRVQQDHSIFQITRRTVRRVLSTRTVILLTPRECRQILELLFTSFIMCRGKQKYFPNQDSFGEMEFVNHRGCVVF